MNECNLRCRITSQDGAGGAVSFLTVNACHVDRGATLCPDGILDALFSALFPLEVVGGRDDAASLGHAVFEHNF